MCWTYFQFQLDGLSSEGQAEKFLQIAVENLRAAFNNNSGLALLHHQIMEASPSRKAVSNRDQRRPMHYIEATYSVMLLLMTFMQELTIIILERFHFYIFIYVYLYVEDIYIYIYKQGWIQKFCSDGKTLYESSMKNSGDELRIIQ